LKLNINYRGDVSFTDQGFDYSGGVEAKDMVMDPDLMTWSIFDDFCKENGVNGEVESIWYKLPEEEIYSARVIGADKDGGIRELCREAMIGREVDIYIVNVVSVPAAFPLPNDVVEDEELGVEDDDAEDIIDEELAAETNECPERVQADGEDPVEERRHDDPRFEAFFNEIHNGTEAADDVADDAAAEDINTVPEETVAEEVEDEDDLRDSVMMQSVRIMQWTQMMNGMRMTKQKDHHLDRSFRRINLHTFGCCRLSIVVKRLRINSCGMY